MYSTQKVSLRTTIILLSYMIACVSVSAQTKQQGPWWPNQQWGAKDQAGASNWITPEKILKALSLVKTGTIYELGHMYEREMPMIGKRSYNLFIPSFPTYGPMGENNVVFNDEYVTSEIGQVGTQFDGPGHVGRRMKMADGTSTEVFYNGYTTEDIRSPYGLLQLGVEHVKPIITKGIYIDLAGYKNANILPEGYEVTLADVRQALSKQGLSEKDIEPGDALLFNFGWWRHWPKPIATNAVAPYVSAEVIQWIIGKKPSMVGSDANLDGAASLVHTEITMKNGIFNLEFMTFESLQNENIYKFLFIFTPLRLKGATGSPGRPIAIR